MKKAQKQKKFRIFSGIAVGVLGLAVVLTIFGMSWSISQIDKTVVSKEPSAILASAGVEEGKNIALAVAYYDQEADACVNLYDVNAKKMSEERQFEWNDCGYYNTAIETGIVDFELNEKGVPTAIGGELTPNRGVKGDNFERWFSAVEGKSTGYAGVLKMAYRAENAEFSFHQDEFYPLDEVATAVANTKHNELFTMNLAIPFTVTTSGNEYFEITADDDTFVFVGNKLALDMGGIHEGTTARLMIKETGEIYAATEDGSYGYTGIEVETGESALIRIFHANRDSGTKSTFNIVTREMNLTVTSSVLATEEEVQNGTEIAYDPSISGYTAPLGESEIFQPDNTKSFVMMATIEGVAVVVLTILIATAVRYSIRARTK